MTDSANDSTAEIGTAERPAPTRVMALAFGIGTIVGLGVAMTWLPRRRRRRSLPRYLARRYGRARKSSRATLGELRDSGRELITDFRHELAANVEAAREGLSEMAREQLHGLRKSMRHERRKILG